MIFHPWIAIARCRRAQQRPSFLPNTLRGQAKPSTLARPSTLALLMALSPWLYAGRLDVVVTDNAARPIADAVIFIDSGKAAATGATPAIVDQVNREFVPRVRVIQQGQSVIFPNSDNIRHHVYSFSTPKVFEIQLYAGVPKTPVMFDKPGVVVLGCNIHDSMVGYLIVAPGDVFAKTDASGNAVLNVATTPARISLWHPLLAADKAVINTIDLPSPSADGKIHVQLSLAADKPAEKNSTLSRLRSLRRAN